ncbi:MAG: hypothetical protein WC076_09490 [Terrimicrobiaceae bacterium]
MFASSRPPEDWVTLAKPENAEASSATSNAITAQATRISIKENAAGEKKTRLTGESDLGNCRDIEGREERDFKTTLST